MDGRAALAIGGGCVIRRVLMAVGISVVTGAVAAPALAVAGESARTVRVASASAASIMPRSGEWWFTTWKVLPKVWPVTQAAGVTVAVVDSGVQANVPDLRGAVVAGGDVTGHHTNGEADFNTVGDGHGTQMAVLIAGRGFGTGMVGMAVKSKILPVVVNADADDQNTSPAAVAAGIRYAADHGAKVIDVPLVHPSPSASGCDAVEQTAVAYALARDAIVIAPAGSADLIGAVPSEPGSCAGVLSVGAIQQNRSLWPGNGREPYITAVAAGAGLISSGRDGRLVTNVSGPIPASAQVAAVVALVRSEFPSLRWYQVVQHVIGTALPVGAPTPNDSAGFGIVRLSHLVDPTTFPVPASTPDPVYARYLAWLSSPQGRAFSRQSAGLAANASRASSPMARKTFSIWPVAAAVAAILAIGVVAVLFLAANRRPKHARRRFAGSAMNLRTPAEPALGIEQLPSLLLAEDPLPSETRPYRIPPYSPVPAPRSMATGPLVPDGEFYFPDDR
jgi:subtilisin family serine protease